MLCCKVVQKFHVPSNNLNHFYNPNSLVVLHIFFKFIWVSMLRLCCVCNALIVRCCSCEVDKHPKFMMCHMVTQFCRIAKANAGLKTFLGSLKFKSSNFLPPPNYFIQAAGATMKQQVLLKSKFMPNSVNSGSVYYFRIILIYDVMSAIVQYNDSFFWLQFF